MHPIGVFDSGVGGLTVLRAIAHHFPGQPAIYVADQAHVPYGGRDLAEVRSFAEGISRALVEAGCKVIVMACNISSATAVEAVESAFPNVPVIEMIGGACRHAVRQSESAIGVLTTQGTLQSGAYRRKLLEAKPGAMVVEEACPEFVPIVEQGMMGSEQARAAVRKRLQPLADAGCDTVILGCTHYPFLFDDLRSAATDLFENTPRFIDPAQETVSAINNLFSGDGASAEYHMLTTGPTEPFAAQLQKLLPGLASTVEQAVWNTSGMLILPPHTANTSF
jgi:glutamate racemase